MSTTGKKISLWFAIALVALVLDQVTKIWAENALGNDEVIVLTSFFEFQLAYNKGAAFSFLYSAGGWQRWFLSGLALVVSVLISVWIVRTQKQHAQGRHWELLGLSLILGGAIGNLVDRVLYGHVIDFIVWHYEQYYWPTFNIADTAICIGAGLLVLDMLFVADKTKEAVVHE